MMRVVVIANDVVPGMGLPVAAPGLRAHGLAAGLRAHGAEVMTVVDEGPVRRADPEGGRTVPSGVTVVPREQMQDQLELLTPAVVLFSNANHAPVLVAHPSLRFVFDGFAPQLLERSASAGRTGGLEAIEARKTAALLLADAIIVNGHKKMSYYRDWIERVGRDQDGLPMHVVEMCVPEPPPARRDPVSLRVLVAGYLQRWSHPGRWLQLVLDRAAAHGAIVDLVIGSHWGAADPGSNEVLDDARKHPAVSDHPLMSYDEFRELLATVDLAVDLFDHTPERELAMVTRTVVALAAGVPVVHPPFTEVSPLIEEYQAGWLVDPDDGATIVRLLDEVLASSDERTRRRQGALRLYGERLEPSVAVAEAMPTIARLFDEASGDEG